MLFSEFRNKEVISIKDCKKLGHVCDIEFDYCKGCIEKIIVPGKNRLFCFLCPDPEYCIPYCNIKQIGPDVILVDV